MMNPEAGPVGSTAVNILQHTAPAPTAATAHTRMLRQERTGSGIGLGARRNGCAWRAGVAAEEAEGAEAAQDGATHGVEQIVSGEEMRVGDPVARLEIGGGREGGRKPEVERTRQVGLAEEVEGPDGAVVAGPGGTAEPQLGTADGERRETIVDPCGRGYTPD